MLEIYDFTGLSSSQFNYKGLRMLSNSLKLCQANYPEVRRRKSDIAAAPLFAARYFQTRSHSSLCRARRHSGVLIMQDLCQTYLINVPKFFTMMWGMITKGEICNLIVICEPHHPIANAAWCPV